MSTNTEGRLRVYWRVGSEKKIAKRYRNGWTARHLEWDSEGERVIVLWERVTPSPRGAVNRRSVPTLPSPAVGEQR